MIDLDIGGTWSEARAIDSAFCPSRYSTSFYQSFMRRTSDGRAATERLNHHHHPPPFPVSVQCVQYTAVQNINNAIKRNLHSQNQVRETHDEVNLLREADYESKQ